MGEMQYLMRKSLQEIDVCGPVREGFLAGSMLAQVLYGKCTKKDIQGSKRKVGGNQIQNINISVMKFNQYIILQNITYEITISPKILSHFACRRE